MKNSLFELLVSLIQQALANKHLSRASMDKLNKQLDEITTNADNNTDKEVEENGYIINLNFITTPNKATFRIFSACECSKLDTKCRSFLLVVEQMGMLTPTQRETIINHIMRSDIEKVTLEDLKWITFMVLNKNVGIRESIWIKSLFFQKNRNNLLH